jgi:hypothetical protein
MKYFDMAEPNAWSIKRWLFMWIYVKKMEQVISFIAEDRKAKKLILDFYVNFSEKYRVSEKDH